MSHKSKCPRAARRRGHRYYHIHPYHTGTIPYPQPFPVCELHGVGIVAEFPEGCPLADRNPLAKITEMIEAAWRLMGHDDPRAGAMFTSADVCHGCIKRKLQDKHVRMLRGGDND